MLQESYKFQHNFELLCLNHFVNEAVIIFTYVGLHKFLKHHQDT